MTIATPQTTRTTPGMERCALWTIWVLFVAINLATLTRLPKVWLDEVTDTDTAYNLVTGRGFVSTAWFGAKSDEFFTFNPAYPFCLAGWFRVVGLGIIQSRLFDLIIVALAGSILYATLRRRHGPECWLPRIGLLIVVLMGDEFVRSYRGHRYDFLSLLWFACLYSVAFMKVGRLRMALTVLFAILLPLTSFNAVALSAIVLGCMFIVTKGRALSDCLVIGTGILIGLCLLLGIHVYHGTLDSLGSLTQPFVDGSFEEDTFLQITLKGIRASHSAVILAIGATVMLWRDPGLAPPARNLLALAALATPGIPLLMSFIGRFSYFYAWTMVLPVALLFAEGCSMAIAFDSRPRYWLAILAGVILCVGLPLRTIPVVLEWKERDYTTIEQFVVRNIEPTDVVLYDPAAYYPCKAIASGTFISCCLRGMTAPERQSISVIVLSNEEAPWRTPAWHTNFFKKFGREWQLVDELVIPRSELRQRLLPPREPSVYDLHVYRPARATPSSDFK